MGDEETNISLREKVRVATDDEVLHAAQGHIVHDFRVSFSSGVDAESSVGGHVGYGCFIEEKRQHFGR